MDETREEAWIVRVCTCGALFEGPNCAPVRFRVARWLREHREHLAGAPLL